METRSISLDRQQYRAVNSDSKNILCVAGPGAGKTRTLVERVAMLVEKNKVSAYSLCLVTFTRKASCEMRERIEERLGSAATHMTIGTFHSIALQFIKRFGEFIGYTPARNITVYGEFEEQLLLKEIAIDLGIYKGKKWKIPKKDIDAVFADFYERGKRPEETSSLFPLFQEFNARCKENRSITYGGLIVAFKELLPHISKYIKWQHLMVDETHDCDALQFEIINTIKEFCGCSVFMVSDTDQTIYSWRGAAPEYLIEHQDAFDLLPLLNNYRSLPGIVERSNNLINHNKQRIPKEMIATRIVPPGHERFEWEISPEYEMDSSALASKIGVYYSRNPTRSIAVLSRTHALLNKLSSELGALGVPHQKIGRKTELVESEDFRRFHSYLKLSINPYDNFSFMLIKEQLGVDRQAYNELRLKATIECKSHYQAWRDNGKHDLAPHLFTQNPDVSFQQYVTFLANVLEPHFDGERLKLIVFFIYLWATENPRGTVREYLDWLSQWDIQDEIKDQAQDDIKKIQLMTIHAAKGLEFDTVFVIGCNEGILPSGRATTEDDIEEERRLFYVAMTRAKDHLFLCVRPESKTDEYGRTRNEPISRFIGEALA